MEGIKELIQTLFAYWERSKHVNTTW
jgi:hypothetical protein